MWTEDSFDIRHNAAWGRMKQINRERMPTRNRINLIFLAFLVLYLLGDGDVGIGTGRAAFQFGHRNLPRYFKMHQNRSSLHPHGRSCINLNLRALVSHDANLLRFHQLISISGLLRRSFKCPKSHSRTSAPLPGSQVVYLFEACVAILPATCWQFLSQKILPAILREGFGFGWRSSLAKTIEKAIFKWSEDDVCSYPS